MRIFEDFFDEVDIETNTQNIDQISIDDIDGDNVVYIKNADYEVLSLLRRMIESYHDKYKDRGYYKNVTLHFDFNPIRGYQWDKRIKTRKLR